MGMKSTVQVIVFFRRKLQLVYAVTQMEGGLGALTAGLGCCQSHSTHTGRSAGHTSHRGEWEVCLDSSQRHWLLVQALWVTEIETGQHTSVSY